MRKANKVTYLDNAATTPMCVEAKEAMFAYIDSASPGNPSGAHFSAQNARRELDDAREKLADIFGVANGDVIFCSGGTESDNLAIFGSNLNLNQNSTPTIFCSAIEHPAVLRPIQSLGGETLPVLPSGTLDLAQLKEVLSEDTQFVSVMAVNNETGIIQPLAEVAEIVKELAPNALLHTDVAQAVFWLDLAECVKDFDLISLSSHKFGGPAGMGALLVRNSTMSLQLKPQLLGGKQERDRRSGTQNVAGAIAMSIAAEVAVRTRVSTNKNISKLRDKLIAGLKAEISDICITGEQNNSEQNNRVAGACHVCIPNIIGEELLFLLTQNGVEASAASSCASGGAESSYVLSAMGYSENLAKGSLRLFLGPTTQVENIDHALDVIPKAVAQLRK